MPSLPSTFRCYLVDKNAAGDVSGAVVDRPLAELPDGDVLLRVAYSSLNYKDALAATGHPGVARRFPHVPGIDAAGTVVESRSDHWRAGDTVVVTGNELGAGHWGGYAQYIRVPADWIVPLPEGLSLRESMILGTAGFTAAQSVLALVEHGIYAKRGEVVVTGASGGVGSVAVALLAQLGYNVTAASGKESAHELLRKLGARHIVGRAEVDDRGTQPLLKARWAGAIDTVGGNTLVTLLRSTAIGGCVAACGLVGGVELPLTVHPFILRGVTLAGITSAWCPMPRRLEIWKRLAGEWKPRNLEMLATEIGLDELPHYVSEILAGRTMGRIVVRIG